MARVLLAMQNEDECAALLEDLMTIKERRDLVQRLLVVKLLAQKIPYSQISEKTGVSSATISRVNQCYLYGAGGYRSVLERLGFQEEE